MISKETLGSGEVARRTHILNPKVVSSALVVAGILIITGGSYDAFKKDSRMKNWLDSKYPPLGTPEEVKSAKTEYVLFHKKMDDAVLKHEPISALTSDAEAKLSRQIELIKQDDQRNKLIFPPIHENLRIFLDLSLGIGGGAILAVAGLIKLRKKRT